MRQNAGERWDMKGELDISGGTLTLADSQVARAKLTKEALSEAVLPLEHLRVWDDLDSVLPETAATDDLALIEGTFGTSAPVVRTSDAGEVTDLTQRARIRVALGPEYIAAGDVRIRVRAGMETAVSDTTATVDVECYADDDDGGVGADLCTTDAQSINSTDNADKDFTITATNLAVGVVLDIRITIAITDGATAVVYGEISKLSLLRDIRG